MQFSTRPFLVGLVGVLGAAACSNNPGLAGLGDVGGGQGGGAGNGGGGNGVSTGGGKGGSGKGGTGGFTFIPVDGGSVVPVGGGGTDGGVGPEGSCGYDKFNLERLPPEILMVLDRSSSMSSAVRGTNNNRYVEVTGAIDTVVQETDSGVLWGLKMFPTDGGCIVADAPEVPIAAMNYSKVSPAMKGTGPSQPNPIANLGTTPTSAAMRSATAHLKTLTSKNPKFILLATDGIPSCEDDALGNSLRAIGEARMAGFPTFVVGIQPDSGEQAALNQMAVEGGEPRNDPMTKYYPVTNRDDLSAALRTITGSVVNCTFPLSKLPPAPDLVRVNVDGVKILPGMVDGWSYGPGNMSINFNGALCDNLKSGQAKNVDITLGCQNFPIP